MPATQRKSTTDYTDYTDIGIKYDRVKTFYISPDLQESRDPCHPW
jgi:hypothetical protein